MARLLGGEPAPEFAHACHQATGGNPLLLRELVAALLEAGTDPTADAALHVPEVDARSVARSVLVRLSRLLPTARSLAVGAAVLQERSRVDEAAELMKLQPAAAQEAADQLIAAGILEARLELAFSHPIVRSAIYQDLSPHARSGLELRAARLRNARGAALDRVAGHLLAVEPAGDEWVELRLREAAEEASGRGAPDAAATYLCRALSEQPPDSDRAALLGELALAQFGAGEIPESFGSFDEALDLSRSAEQRVEIGSDYARRQAILQTGRGAVIMDDLLEGLEPGSALAGVVEAEHLSFSIVHTSRFPVARDRLKQLREIGGVENPLLLATMAAAAAGSAEPVNIVADLALRAISGGLRGYVRSGVFTPVAYAGTALTIAERYEESAAFWEYVIEEAARAGTPVVHAIGSCYRADLNLRRGRVIDAEADARTSVRLFGESGVEHLEAISYLAQALVERDRADEALELLNAATIPEPPRLWGHYVALFSRARAKVAEGMVEAALDDLRRCADPGALSFGSVAFHWRSETAVALHRLGDSEAAEELASEELRLAVAARAPRAIGIAGTVLGSIAGRKGSVPALRRAEAALEDTPAELERARTSVALGAALRRAGQRREARDVLREGLTRAQMCGGLRVCRLAREELAAAGAKPRRDELRGRDALTASEHRVAALAIEGQTNAEIAQQLFVTRRTVETHLTHAYQKLDIQGRNELAGAIKPSSRPEILTGP